jgi:hypothetical protein
MYSRLHWKHHLKSPTQPGLYPIPGTPYNVLVEEAHIADAAKWSGNVTYDLLDGRTLAEPNTYNLGVLGSPSP